jgi:hypothetical protein
MPADIKSPSSFDDFCLMVWSYRYQLDNTVGSNSFRRLASSKAHQRSRTSRFCRRYMCLKNPTLLLLLIAFSIAAEKAALNASSGPFLDKDIFTSSLMRIAVNRGLPLRCVISEAFVLACSLTLELCASSLDVLLPKAADVKEPAEETLHFLWFQAGKVIDDHQFACLCWAFHDGR